MFVDGIEQTFVGAIGAIKDLAFAIKNKFLKIKGHRFRDTEIAGILENVHFHFLAHAEEMIDSVAAGENDSGIILNLDLLLAEFPCRNWLEANERMKIQLYAEFS